MKSYKVIREEILIKTYKHLYTKLLSDDNISESIHNAWKNKHHRTQLMECLNAYRFEKTVIELVKKWIINFKNAHHVPIKIKDPSSGKIREIYKPTVREQVVHHCLMNVLKPIIMK